MKHLQRSTQVISVLVMAIFSQPGLKWGPQHEIDHLELFAGDASVSRGEHEDIRRPKLRGCFLLFNWEKHCSQLAYCAGR